MYHAKLVLNELSFIKKLKPFGFCILAIFWLAGCATVHEPHVKTDAEKKALRQLALSNEYKQALKMSGVVYLKTKNGWMKSRVALLLSRPDSMRITLFDPAGMAWFVATANAKSVSYATADRKKQKLMARDKEQVFRIGPVNISPDDLIRFIHPGIDAAWLESGRVTVKNRSLRVAHGNISTQLKFNSANSLESAMIRRQNSAPLRFSYQNKNNVLYVTVNKKIRFEFKRIERAGNLPEELFEPVVSH